MNNPLFDVLPANVRKYVYALLALGALAFSIFQAVDGDWLQFVGGLLTALVGSTAASNTHPTPVSEPGDVAVTDDAVDETEPLEH